MLYEHYNVVFTCTTQSRLEQVNGLLAQIEEEGTAQHRREIGGQEGKGKGEGEREGKTLYQSLTLSLWVVVQIDLQA